MDGMTDDSIPETTAASGRHTDPPPTIRPYRDGDGEATMRVFREAILRTAAAHYDATRTRIWASRAGSPADWHRRRMAARTIVACPPGGDGQPGPVVGFTDLDDDGYIDMLFVDPDHGGRGVGGALLERVTALARTRGIPQLSVHASITAQPLFERAGFRLSAECRPVLDGVAFVNYLMVRPLADDADAGTDLTAPGADAATV